MGVEIRASNSNTGRQTSSGGVITVEIPADILVGDLMIVFYECESFNQFSGLSTNLGTWTVEKKLGANGFGYGALSKVAEAGDAGSTFELSVANEQPLAFSIGVVGVFNFDGDTPISASAGASVSGDNTPSYANGITPTDAESMIFMSVGTATFSGGAATVSGYAIATSDPTWTELYDVQSTAAASKRVGGSLAWGIRAATTDTGNSSCTISSSETTNNAGLLLAVSPGDGGGGGAVGNAIFFSCNF